MCRYFEYFSIKYIIDVFLLFYELLYIVFYLLLYKIFNFFFCELVLLMSFILGVLM